MGCCSSSTTQLRREVDSGNSDTIAIHVVYPDSSVEVVHLPKDATKCDLRMRVAEHFVDKDPDSLISLDFLGKNVGDLEALGVYDGGRVTSYLTPRKGPFDEASEAAKNKNTMVFLCKISGANFAIRVDRHATVRRAKEELQNIGSRPAGDIMFVYHGRHLEDDMQLLSYGVKDASVVQVLMRANQR